MLSTSDIKSQGTDQLSDNIAKQELATKFADGKRGEAYRDHIHIIVIAGLYVVGAILLSLMLIRAWHFMAPCYLKWLTDVQNHDIERILFSGGIIASLAGRYFKKYKVIE